MATIEIKSMDGKAVGKHNLGAGIENAAPLMSVLHRAVVAEEANSRQGTQKTKTRAEVRGGGRKPYKQKKTGNARQGSIRSPHYAHGGMALAISPRDYTKKLNRKERRAALLGAFRAQVDGGNVLGVEKIAFDAPRTKDAQALLEKLGVDGATRILVVLGKYDEVAYKSFRNMPNVVVRTAPAKQIEAAKEEEKPKKGKKAAPAESTKTVTFSTRDLLLAKKIIVTAAALKAIEEVWA